MGSRGRRWSDTEGVTSRGKKIWELEERETEEELKKYLNGGGDFPADEIDETEENDEAMEDIANVNKSDEEAFKTLGEYWTVEY